MKKEKIKNMMEQSSKENEVTKNEVAKAEEKADFVNDEMQPTSINATNTATANATTVQRTIMVPADAVEFETYCSDTIDGEGAFYSDEGGWVGYYYPQNKYYYAKCWIKAEDVGVVEENFKNGTLSLSFSNESSGMKVFDFLTLDGEYLGSWGDEIDVAEVYNEETGQAEFKIVPAQGCTGSIIIAKSNLLLTYNATLQGISVTTPPTKTKYAKDETFDASGMVVTTTYSDGNTQTITDYTISNSGTLSFKERITISYGGFEVDSGIRVLTERDINYGNSNNDNQVMDIHIPETPKGPNGSPVVITIHGGDWREPNNKGYYNYMTQFITETCNCVHVNMTYRLTTGVPGGNDITYEDMLEDIQSVINFISNENNSTTYHINSNKIALMGHSAGGHLALLYAYKNPTQIDLVISEAGPTYFTVDSVSALPNWAQDEICAMVGTTMNDSGLATKLANASPCTYANSNSPYTVLAYGSGLDTLGVEGAGDGIVFYSQVEELRDELVGYNFRLFNLVEISHWDFGENENKTPKKIHPNSTHEMALPYYSCNDFNNPGLKELINIHLFGNTNS